MALPKLNTMTYELELPSNGETIKYRPFLVKEQKLLMIAQESDDDKQIQDAFAQIIKDCTFEELDPYVMPMFDLEYVFLQLRSRSVGEKVKLKLICPDDNKTEVEVEIDLKNVDVQMTEDHTNVVTLTEDITMIMKYPSLSDMEGFDPQGKILSLFEMIKRCIMEIRDGETIHNKVDISNKDLDKFIDSIQLKILKE